jgi:MoaA/NifB/PqqE/SkfB family radical SAM enzyme
MGIYNRAAFFATLLKDRIIGKRTPLVVVLNTTFHCNLKCGYCYGQYFKKNNKDFSTEELFDLIKGLKKLGTRSITLGGGEPLIRDDIGVIIKAIKDSGIECGMNTNGVLIPSRIKELKSIDMVTVSLDGPKEMNDANRGEGSFEKIMAGIDAALANRLKVHTTTVITQHNYEAVDWLVNLANRKGLQAEFNFLFNQSEDKSDSERFMAENGHLRKSALRIAELKAQGAPILFSENVYRYVADWPNYKNRVVMGQKPSFPFIPCYAGKFMMFIDADGKVYPCVQLIDIFDALDFRKVGIEKAWNNCAKHNCKACYFPCFNELNCIMGLNLKVISEQITSTVKRQ